MGMLLARRRDALMSNEVPNIETVEEVTDTASEDAAVEKPVRKYTKKTE